MARYFVATSNYFSVSSVNEDSVTPWLYDIVNGSVPNTVPNNVNTSVVESDFFLRQSTYCRGALLSQPIAGVDVFIAERDILNLSVDAIQDLRNYDALETLSTSQWLEGLPLIYPINPNFVYTFVYNSGEKIILWSSVRSSDPMSINEVERVLTSSTYTSVPADQGLGYANVDINGTIETQKCFQIVEGTDPLRLHYQDEYNYFIDELTEQQPIELAVATRVAHYRPISVNITNGVNNQMVNSVQIVGDVDFIPVFKYTEMNPKFNIDGVNAWNSAPASYKSMNLCAFQATLDKIQSRLLQSNELIEVDARFIGLSIETQVVNVETPDTNPLKPWHLLASAVAGAIIAGDN